jgi:hypothetical protein
MRHVLGILVATTTLLFAAGCGADPADTGGTTNQPTPQPQVVAILSATAIGGQISKVAVDLGAPSGIDQLVGGLNRDSLENQVRAKVAATQVPEGRRLVGAIVSVGCDRPVDVKVVDAGGAVRLEPIFAGKSTMECFAAVTSIALVLVI